MAYSNFTATQLKDRFGIRQRFVDNLFTAVEKHQPSARLLDTLSYNVSFALSQGSEKARSEFIIAPVLAELARESDGRLSIFSGIDFTVDEERGLSGFCDFLISRSPEQVTLEAPVVAAVQAKRDDFNQGINQCIAEMIAARIYNERGGHPTPEVYGCVTIGNVWQFLVLRDNLALIETATLEIREDLERILGILRAMSLGEIVAVQPQR